MSFYSDPITRLIEKFAALPGIGRKSAQRLAFYVIGMDEKEARELADAIISAKKDVKYCAVILPTAIYARYAPAKKGTKN